VLNVWSTHQFWIGFLTSLGIKANNIVFSSDTSEEQYRTFGKGRGTVDSCYPVKCVSGHYGELVFGQKRKIDVLLSPWSTRCPPFCMGM
jgi:predicted nucleotide-binding protein (sugar kinase/HSP70/actin superfamily)